MEIYTKLVAGYRYVKHKL